MFDCFPFNMPIAPLEREPDADHDAFWRKSYDAAGIPQPEASSTANNAPGMPQNQRNVPAPSIASEKAEKPASEAHSAKERMEDTIGFGSPLRPVVVSVKKLRPDAQLPRKATEWSAGYDLFSVRKQVGDGFEKHFFGLAFAIPKGYAGLLFPRSSCAKTGQWMGNSVGVIDADYRGEVSAVFYTTDSSRPYHPGDRVAQLIVIPVPRPVFMEVPELDETERGEGGYGSTGK